MQDLAPAAANRHVFELYVTNVACKSGSGISFVGAGLDVIGTK
jgi:hypothetical protein